MIFRESALFPLLKVPSVFVTVSMSKLRMAVPVQHGARVVADEVPVAAELAAVGDLAQLRLHLAHDPLHGITVLPVPALTHRLSRGYSEDDLTDTCTPHHPPQHVGGQVRDLQAVEALLSATQHISPTQQTLCRVTCCF